MNDFDVKQQLIFLGTLLGSEFSSRFFFQKQKYSSRTSIGDDLNFYVTIRKYCNCVIISYFSHLGHQHQGTIFYINVRVLWSTECVTHNGLRENTSCNALYSAKTQTRLAQATLLARNNQVQGTHASYVKVATG